MLRLGVTIYLERPPSSWFMGLSFFMANSTDSRMTLSCHFNDLHSWYLSAQWVFHRVHVFDLLLRPRNGLNPLTWQYTRVIQFDTGPQKGIIPTLFKRQYKLQWLISLVVAHGPQKVSSVMFLLGREVLFFFFASAYLFIYLFLLFLHRLSACTFSDSGRWCLCSLIRAV